MRTHLLSPGEPAPWFVAPCGERSDFRFDSVAGRHVVLCFFGSAADANGRRVLDDFAAAQAVFDDRQACFFGVSVDPADAARLGPAARGLRYFQDFDFQVSGLYGAARGEQQVAFRQHTLVLDERLRVAAVIPFDDDIATHVPRVLEALAALPALPPATPASLQAPILVVPRVFEPALGQALIDYYDRHGGEESGFMRDVGGKTVAVSDPSFKLRRDQEIVDEPLRRACMARVHDRLVPEIHKAFQFQATRIERYIVACYDAATGGYFRPHRDNTTRGTAHRRFAVSLNLNTGQYDGGELRFPEFGLMTYTAPAGGAVVFSCSLLHEATPVTRGKRYAFLPFLYDEAARKVRDENLRFVEHGGQASGVSKPTSTS